VPEDNIDLNSVVEQLQHENERLREKLARLKVFPVTWDLIRQVTINLFTDVHYVLGLATGIFFVLVLFVFFGGSHATA
jgi:hypothetical protein